MKRLCFILLILLVFISSACTSTAAGDQSTPAKTIERPDQIESIENCPVTRPSDPPFTPPGEVGQGFENKFWYGSDSLYLALPADGSWPQLAKGDKVFWWSDLYPGAADEQEPGITIRGEQLNQPHLTVEQSGATNAMHSSFPGDAILHGLELPAAGCWQITGDYRGESLTFVVLVP